MTDTTRFRVLAVMLVTMLAVALAGCTTSLVGTARAASPSIVISQVYGGGGNSGSTYKNDFIELFNRGTTAVNVTGWSVQYTSSTGKSWQKTDLSGAIEPGKYYLVQEAQGANGTSNLPTPDATGTITMSGSTGKVALTSKATLLSGSCPTGLMDMVGFGATNCSEGKPTAALSNSMAALRSNGGCSDSDNNAADFAAAPPSPRNSNVAANLCSAAASDGNAAAATPTIVATAGSNAAPLAVTPIHDVQGAAHTSPLRGQVVSVQGIVTAKRSNGFYMQDPNPDNNPATSEGIFIFTRSAPAVNVGDMVLASGTVQEFAGSGSAATTNLSVTEIGEPGLTYSVLSSANALPAPVVIGAGGRLPPTQIIEDDATGDVESSGAFDPEQDGIDFYESLEGMLVQVNNPVAVGPTSSFSSNREIPVVADNGDHAGERTPRGGIVIQPGDYNPERIILNDLISDGPNLPAANVGDRFPGAVTGIIDYSFGNFKLQVTHLPDKVSGGLMRETAGAVPADHLAIGTFNVQNLAPSDPATKFSTLAGLIVNNLKSPDILAIEEIQDNSGATNNGIVAADVTWGKLIDAIKTAGGPAYTYRQIDPVNDQDGGEPGGNIRQGFLFRSDRGLSFVDHAGGGSTTATAVSGSGAAIELTYSPGRIDPTNPAFKASRKPLAGEFTFHGDKVFVIANHFNSKGGDEPLFGRFQPPTFSSEVERIKQAQIVHDFAGQILAADPNANVVVLGDLNDFQFSKPVATLKGDILIDLIDTLPANERYSYVYEGNSETLDQTLVSKSIAARSLAYDVVHVNAEFADQASDHEPQVSYICLNAAAPTLSVSATPMTLWPADHKMVTVTASTDLSDNSSNNGNPAPGVSLVSVTSDEPDSGLGDGDVANDIQIVNDHTFMLRAEHAGDGKGRAYTITYQTSGSCGNVTTSSVTVTVPHDKGK